MMLKKYLQSFYASTKIDFNPKSEPEIDIDFLAPSSTPEDKSLWWNVLKK